MAESGYLGQSFHLVCLLNPPTFSFQHLDQAQRLLEHAQARHAVSCWVALSPLLISLFSFPIHLVFLEVQIFTHLITRKQLQGWQRTPLMRNIYACLSHSSHGSCVAIRGQLLEVYSSLPPGVRGFQFRPCMASTLIHWAILPAPENFGVHFLARIIFSMISNLLYRGCRIFFFSMTLSLRLRAPGSERQRCAQVFDCGVPLGIQASEQVPKLEWRWREGGLDLSHIQTSPNYNYLSQLHWKGARWSSLLAFDYRRSYNQVWAAPFCQGQDL